MCEREGERKHKPVKHKKADVFWSFILERHVIWDHNGSVKRQTENNPIPVGIGREKSGREKKSQLEINNKQTHRIRERVAFFFAS